MVSLKDALTLVLEHAFPLEAERVFLPDSLGRVTAAPVLAPMNVPPFERSPLDGYAVRAEDTFAASPEQPVTLAVLAKTKGKSIYVKSGTCIRILTGDPFPRGADAVVPQEKVLRVGNLLFLHNPLPPEANVASAGEDIRRGTTVVEKGTLIEAIHIGIFSSLGLQRVDVFKKPRVAVLATGSELKPCGERLSFGQIYDCNTPMLCALISECAAVPNPFGIVGDSTEALACSLEKALEQSDLVISTGGVSVGDDDLVAGAIKKIGAHILFWRVAMKPGTPALAAVKNKKLFFCLPGNPAAAYVSFEQLVRPCLLAKVSLKNWQRPEISALLEHSIPAAGSQNRFMRAICSLGKEGFTVRSAGLERSGVLSSFRDANALICLPAGTPALEAGEKVTVRLLSLPRQQEVLAPHSLSGLTLSCGTGTF